MKIFYAYVYVYATGVSGYIKMLMQFLYGGDRCFTFYIHCIHFIYNIYMLMCNY